MYKEIKREVIKSMENMLKKGNKVLLVGDFNSKAIEVRQNTNSWSDKLMHTMMVNTYISR